MYIDPNRKVLGCVKLGFGLFGINFVKIMKWWSNLVSRVGLGVDGVAYVVVLPSLRGRI